MRDLKRYEERKRERNWDPAMRWKVIQDTITWAEAQPAVRRRRPAKRRPGESVRLRRT